MNKRYYIEKVEYRKLHSDNTEVLLIQGWALDLAKKDSKILLIVDGREVSYDIHTFMREDVCQKAKIETTTVGFSILAKMTTECKESLVLKFLDGETLLSLTASELTMNEKKGFHFSIDSLSKQNKEDQTYCRVLGWANYDKEWIVDFAILDGSKNVDFKLQRIKRMDLVRQFMVFGEAKYAGFLLEFPIEEGKKYTLKMLSQGEEKTVPLRLTSAKFISNTKSFLKKVNRQSWIESKKFIKNYGWKEYKHTFFSSSQDVHYHRWFLNQRIKKSEMFLQQNVHFSFAPKISIIVATFNTSDNFLRDMIGSVIEQSYSNWQLCIADGSDTNAVIEYLEKNHAYDNRIVWKKLEKNYGISGNMNGALELADGDYIGLYDHDDFLEKDCLFEVVKALQDFRYDIVYTDEDKFDNDTKFYIDPNFKPDYNVDLFRSHNYITHFFCVNKKIIDQVGGMNPEYDGSQDYDFMFRCIEKANGIYHVPRILYHWRIHPLSTAGNPESKMYCYEAGQKAIQAHYDRTGVDATVEMMPKPYYGLYRTHYSVGEKPLVSIVIPNMNHKDILKTCIDSLYEVNTYQNFEIIIIENNSTEQEIFDYYKELEETHTNIHVVYWDGIFNYSAINNFGVKATKGNYLLFLNNDTEVITETAIEEMLGCCMRPEVGIVGAKLLYEDDTVQHAGVVVGFNNYAGHVFTEIDKDDLGYMMRPIINCDYSAVTAACMMVKKSTFEKVNGFDEQFKVACNDVDFCLRVRQLDQLVVYNAFALWHHYESKSRGYEDSIEKMERFDGEMARFQKRWQSFLDKGDPYYNKNFNLELGPFRYD